MPLINIWNYERTSGNIWGTRNQFCAFWLTLTTAVHKYKLCAGDHTNLRLLCLIKSTHCTARPGALVSCGSFRFYFLSASR